MTRGPFFKAVTAERKAGAYCVLPLDLQLPSDAAAFLALDFRDFNGNVHELLQICPEVLELDDDSLSLVTRVPRAILWQHALEEKLLQLICTAIYTHRVLKDFSTPLPEYKPTQWLRAKVSCPSPPSPHRHLTPQSPSSSPWPNHQDEPSKWEAASYEGWNARRLHIYGHDGTPVQLTARRPVKVNEVSAAGSAMAELLCAQFHGQKHPGKYTEAS